MTESDDRTYALIHHKRPSLRLKLADCKTACVWFLVVFVLGLVGGFMGGLVGPLVALNLGWGWFLPASFAAGLLVGIPIIFCLRFVDRRLFGAIKTHMTTIENRLIAGSSETAKDDLEKLIAGSLKLKRLEAADIYSKRLLAITMNPSDTAKIPDWVVATECWASTDEYHHSWTYNLVWLHQTRGVLTLSPVSLDFQSKAFTIQCHPSMITSIEIKRHPLWMKPIPLKFISLSIEDFGCRHVFNITPSFGQTDTVWDCNRMVETWAERLELARKAKPRLASVDSVPPNLSTSAEPS